MDVLWLAAVLVSWRCLTRDFWRREVAAADPWAWSWLQRKLRASEGLLVALYRATFFYGLCRMISWTTWAHTITADDHPWDLSWGGPSWVPAVTLDQVPAWVALVTAVALGVAVWAVVDRIVGREAAVPTGAIA